jgi:hypothetical protein
MPAGGAAILPFLSLSFRLKSNPYARQVSRE